MPDTSTFDQAIKTVHQLYDYNAVYEETGEHEDWRYEMWSFCKASTLQHAAPTSGLYTV